MLNPPSLQTDEQVENGLSVAIFGYTYFLINYYSLKEFIYVF